MSTRSRRAPGSPPDKCTCRTPSAAASPKTRTQVAVSSSSSLASSASGLEQYGQPSGQRWVNSASRPSGLCTIAELDNATWRLIQCSGQACCCASVLAPCAIARNPDQAEFHLPSTPVRPAEDVELAWTSAVMTILHHNSKSFLSAKPRNNVLTSARIFSRGAV